MASPGYGATAQVVEPRFSSLRGQDYPRLERAHPIFRINFFEGIGSIIEHPESK